MSNKKCYNKLIEKLSEKIPEDKLLVTEIMDLLSIEEGAAYRRLQKDAHFSIDEIIKIAKTHNISIDEIAGVDSDNIIFKVYPVNFYNPQKKDFDYLAKTTRFLESLKNNSDTEYIEVCNKLPRFLCINYPNLVKFYQFRWIYKYDLQNPNIPFSKVVVQDNIQKIFSDHLDSVKKIKEINYIFDRFLFENIIEDIRYFHKIDLITDGEKELLKKDLLLIINFINEVADTGIFPKTKNKANLYISLINIDTNYSCFRAGDDMVFRIHIFGEYEAKNYDPKTVLEFKKMLELKKKSSTLISTVDSVGRIEYIKKQQKLIEDL